MPSQSFTFFFTTDLLRATDRSQATLWSMPPTSCSAPAVSTTWAFQQPTSR